MNEPLNISRFIALVTSEPLEKDHVKMWFRCVKRCAPSGAVLAIPSADDTGMPQTVALVHREADEKHFYMVPLARDLSEEEAQVIVDAVSRETPDLDFDIHSTSLQAVEPEPAATITVDEANYLDLCTSWAKREHERWMTDRIGQGWRYGTDFSLRNKTHPLLRPWEDLPAKFRVPNLDEPQALLDLLNDQGYTVISKTELESLLSLMRK